ncbi:MAG: universal stress protein [Gammaproteobacteria bacterium]|nr:universal stress protein [Gammaproteobacteria bacterium]
MLIDRILVLTDFSQAAKVAIEHGLQFARSADCELLTLHLVGQKSDVDWALNKSEAEVRAAENFTPDSRFKSMTEIENVFAGTVNLKSKYGSALTFFGTHGKKDIQFITGSYALKLVNNADSPTLVVQKGSPVRPYENILFFVNFGGQEHQDLAVLRTICRVFKSTVHLVHTGEPDDMAIIGDQLKASGIAVNTVALESPRSGALAELMDKAKALDIDLFALPSVNYAVKAARSKVNAQMQKIITNPQQIPTICL